MVASASAVTDSGRTPLAGIASGHRSQMRGDMTEREAAIHRARVCIEQSRSFWKRDNGSRYFAFTLLEWAGNARREANKSTTPDLFATDKPKQGELFV